MHLKFRRSLGSSLILTALLLSACGEAPSAPSVENQQKTTVSVTQPETTEPSTAPNGLTTQYLSDGTPLYLVDLAVYDDPDYNPFSMMAVRNVKIDFYDDSEDSSMGSFFLEKPIRNCAYYNSAFEITFIDGQDNSDLGWQCVYMKGSLDDVTREDRGTYIIPDPDYIALGEQVFSLNEENIGYFDLGTLEPIDLYGFTVIPTIAPNGWSPFMVSIKPQISLVGFLTEEDRQVFLDGLSQ